LASDALTTNGNASVRAGKTILAVRAPGWVERHKLEVEAREKGLSAILKIVAEAKAQPDRAEPDWPVHMPN
jgi:hypothetical protein